LPPTWPQPAEASTGSCSTSRWTSNDAAAAGHCFATGVRSRRTWRSPTADLNADSNRLARFGCGPGARLVEVGSYVGAFLDFARRAGCDIVGVDPNEALAEWCRQRGHDVRTAVFSAELFPRETFDGAWILNCFEQLPDLDDAVQDAHRVLRPGAPLVIRTPNAAFVAAAHHSSSTVLRRVADANAVLGVPYRRCLTSAAIRLLLTRNGFRDVRVRGREFSSLGPRDGPSSWVAWRAPRLAAYTAASLVAGQILHPWLEVVAIRALRPAGCLECRPGRVALTGSVPAQSM
jgi:SAM-dependent methyltransferase